MWNNISAFKVTPITTSNTITITATTNNYKIKLMHNQWSLVYTKCFISRVITLLAVQGFDTDFHPLVRLLFWSSQGSHSFTSGPILSGVAISVCVFSMIHIELSENYK